PRRPTEDDPLGSRAPQRRRTSLVLTLLPVALLLAAVGDLLWNRWSGQEQHPIERAFTALAGLLDLIAHYRKPATTVAFFDLTIAVAVLLFAVGLFALLVLVALAERLEKWWAARSADDTLAPPAPPRAPSPTRAPRSSAPTRASSTCWPRRALRARRGRRRRSSCARRSRGSRCRPHRAGSLPPPSSRRGFAIVPSGA